MSEPTFDAILRVDRNLEEIVFHAPNHQVYRVRFDAFKISDDFVRPGFMDAELIDEGRTVAELLVEVQVKLKSAEPTDDPKTWAINDPRVGLSNRVLCNLDHKQVKTVGDLLRYSEDELLVMRNVGWITLCDIRDRLDKHGLKLKEDQS